MILNISNETALLKAVVLGQPKSMGKTPYLNDTYDAKSYETVKNKAYPKEKDIIEEMGAFEQILLKYGVHVFRPKIIKGCNQIFARDVAFIIDDKIIISNIIPDRVNEQEAYEAIFNTLDFKKIFNLPEKVHIEGGDVVLYNEFVFVGIYEGKDYTQFKTARTNKYAIDFLKELFPHKTIYPLELIKNDTNPYHNVLHLDCTFMPVNKDKVIIYKNGFKHLKNYLFLMELFGKENVFEVTQAEMYTMNTNIFSISPQIIVSEQRFTRMNTYLEQEWKMTVERIPYYEISKMGGLLRCSTLPLIRMNEEV